MSVELIFLIQHSRQKELPLQLKTQIIEGGFGAPVYDNCGIALLLGFASAGQKRRLCADNGSFARGAY
jgi:hypothetical protein